jgi:hypothetical protein
MRRFWVYGRQTLPYRITDALPVIRAAGPMDDLVQFNSQLAADYFFSSASQLVTSTTGAVLSMVEFTNKNLPWRVTS